MQSIPVYVNGAVSLLVILSLIGAVLVVALKHIRRPKRLAALAELAEVLHSLAGYNDKGFIWSGHTPTESDTLRQKYRPQIAALIAIIGDRSLPPALIEAFRSGELLLDDSGKYAEQADNWKLPWW